MKKNKIYSYLFFLLLNVLGFNVLLAQPCGGSLQFNNNSDEVLLPLNNQMHSSNGFTWECWFKLNTAFGSKARSLIMNEDPVVYEDIFLGFGWNLGVGNFPINHLGFKVDGPNSSTGPSFVSCDYAPPGGFQLGTWYHAAGVMNYSTHTAKLYLNGLLVDTEIMNSDPITRNVQGHLSYSPNLALGGNQDEIRIWKRVRTDSEILSDYNHCLSGSETDLLSYYRCNQSSGIILLDGTLNGNNGTLVNSTMWAVPQPSLSGSACSGSGILAVSSPTICAGQTTTLTATGASTYTWSTGAISNSIIVNPSITTSYSVTGSSGSCTNQAISTVSVIPGSTLSITGNTVICAGQSTILSANGPGSFLWNTGATTSSISVSPVSTSTYNVSSPGSMCSGLGTITVNVISSPTISVSGNMGICSTQTTVLTASGANNYVWSTSSTSSSISVNPNITTSYSVVGMVGTCTNQAVATVTVSSQPTISSLNHTNSGCGLSNGSATVSALPSSCTYLWGNASTSNISSNLSSGIQTLSISNNGCITQTFVTIGSQPGPLFISASVNNTSCGLANGSATVTSTPSNNTYLWSSGVSSTTNTAGSLSAGTYTIYAINGACQADTVISVLSSMPLQILTSTIVASDCNANNGSILITDNGVNSTYSWSPGISSNSNSITNLTSGSYSLNISDGACTTSSVYLVPLLTGPTGLNIIQKSAICLSKNGSLNVVAVLNGLSPYQYNFNNSGFSSASTFNNLSQGVYTISVMDANNCIFTQTFTIGISQTTVTVNEIIKPTNCESNDGEIRINNINGGTSPYLISFNNTPYRPDTVFAPLSAGSYSINILDSNKCITGFTIIVPENGEDYSLYIPNTFTPNTDIVNDIWYVQGTCLGEFNCMIYNRWGEKIIELNDIKEGWNGKYKEKEVPEGVYVYMIKVKTKTGTVKRSGHITVFR